MVKENMMLEPNNIYCGDCLELMKSMPDKSVDLILTDPPYGMNYKSNHYKYGQNPHEEIKGDSEYPAWLIGEAKRIARKAVFSFCRWDNLAEVEKPKSFIVWQKNNWTAGDLKHEYGRMWEGILFYPMEKHEFVKRPPDVIKFDRISSTHLQHPTQKPTEICKWLILNNSEDRDIVFDPFMGSGTTCVAAKELGRRYIGIDIEQKYVDIARERLAQDYLF